VPNLQESFLLGNFDFDDLRKVLVRVADASGGVD